MGCLKIKLRLNAFFLQQFGNFGLHFLLACLIAQLLFHLLKRRRIGAAAAGALALVVAGHVDWTTAYLVCSLFALPAMIAALVVAGRKVAHRAPFGQ